MPPFRGMIQEIGVPSTQGPKSVRNFDALPIVAAEQHPTISGTTKDSAGAALGNCDVVLFRTQDDSKASETQSDASGNYRMDASTALQHYAVAYKAGSPDVAGTTVNTLTGT